ncbi:MAG: hypothetical protein WCI92_07240 [Bacteroidota bacterium]
MASTSETGHAKNAANFDTLITCAIGYGATYNPSKPTLLLPALQSQSAEAKNAVRAVNATLPAYTQAVADREVAFAPLNKLTTRILNALKATDTSPQVIESAKALVNKLQGKRTTPKKTEEEKAALLADGKATKEISTSQMSYDSRLDNFDKLVQLLSSAPLYTPNETDLQITSIQALYADLSAKNAAVITATIPLSNARITRNDVLYKPNAGLVDIAMDVKTYIKSVFGASSPQYKQVSALAFKSIPE